MNQNSMLIRLNNTPVFITRKNFNLLMQTGKLENVVIIDKADKNGAILKWVAVPSIF
jgi:hypothetical protein